MKKGLIIILMSACLNVFAQQKNDTIYTHASAVISFRVEANIQLELYQSSEIGRSNDFYKIIVDSVFYINVTEEFSVFFNKEYLLSCKYLIVQNNRQDKEYNSKTCLITNKNYIAEVETGYGKQDLEFVSIIPKGTYKAYPKNLTIGSFIFCFENKECKKDSLFFDSLIKQCQSEK